MGYTNYLKRRREMDFVQFIHFCHDTAFLLVKWFDYCTGKNRSFKITHHDANEALPVKALSSEQLLDSEDTWGDTMACLAILESDKSEEVRVDALTQMWMEDREINFCPCDTESIEIPFNGDGFIFTKTHCRQPQDILVAAVYLLAEEVTGGAFKASSDDCYQMDLGFELLRAVFGESRFPVYPKFTFDKDSHRDHLLNAFITVSEEHPDLKLRELMPFILKALDKRFDLKDVSFAKMEDRLKERLELVLSGGTHPITKIEDCRSVLAECAFRVLR